MIAKVFAKESAATAIGGILWNFKYERKVVMTFTVLGDNVTAWGSKF